jgi:protein-disulfide isomerase
MLMKTLRGITAVSAALLLFAVAPSAQQAQSAPQAQPSPSQMTQRQLDEEMLKELRQIRQLLERLTQPQQPPGPPSTATITSLSGFAMGNPQAPLTMVEFTDLQCPFCRQYITASFPDIKKNWIDTGKLRYISRDFPLDFHPQAMNAARAARCGGEQGKFWEMRLALMRNANLLSPDYIAQAAAGLGLDSKAFAACTASTKYDAQIQAETDEGNRIGITGTPTFVLGLSTPDRLEGPVIVGAMPYRVFDAKLTELLSIANGK